MDKYFFNVTGVDDYRDAIGYHFACLEDARTEAIRYFGEMLMFFKQAYKSCDKWELTVCNEKGAVLLSFRFHIDESSSTGGSSYAAKVGWLARPQ